MLSIYNTVSVSPVYLNPVVLGNNNVFENFNLYEKLNNLLDGLKQINFNLFGGNNHQVSIKEESYKFSAGENNHQVSMEEEDFIASLSPLVPKFQCLSSVFGHSVFKCMNFPFKQDTNQKWLHEIDRLLGEGTLSIEAVEEGISTTYLLSDATGKKLALFKPDSGTDEYTDNQQSSIREHLAWEIGKELVKTPPLFVAELTIDGKPLVGSLQQFVQTDGTFGKYIQGFTKTLPPTFYGDTILRMASKEITRNNPSAVRGMAILDFLIQNSDRKNPANTLIKKSAHKMDLIAIDHNLAFSSKIASDTYAWVFWYHSEAIRQPFSDKEIRWINSLDAKKITDKMMEAGLDPKRISTFKKMVAFLQTGAKAGLTLFDIATLRKGDNFFGSVSSSRFETIANAVEEMNLNPDDKKKELYRQMHTLVMDVKDRVKEFGKTREFKIQEYVYNNIYKTEDHSYLHREIKKECENESPLPGYTEAKSCPKEYIDLRFNETQPENFL